MTRRVLVFPGGMPRSLAFLERALIDGTGTSIVGASSLGHDPARDRYPHWVHLPYVTAPEFSEALGRVIAELDIGGIFTPNPVVWDYLNRCLPVSFPDVRLVNTSPVDTELAPYQKALQFSRSVLDQPLELAAVWPSKPCVSALQLAALFFHADSIPGMCDHEKIRALCEVFRHSPSGDIVEIGSWWGKSAFVLSWLARCYGIGKLLCVDPWSNEHLIQNDDQGMLDHIPVNADEALSVFQINLLPYAHDDVNFLRLPSVEASGVYRRQRTAVTSSFGETTYCGQIAVLHIDGNHSYDNARADLASWNDLVMHGGWIIVDDYIWPYGDGPKRVGDKFLFDLPSKIGCSFVMGSALFIQIV